MRNTSVVIKKGWFAFILLLLILPLFQEKFDLFTLKPLEGAIIYPDTSHFDIKNWLSSEYQKNEEIYLNETFGFRSLFIRINNQIAFSLFNKAKANGVIIGKNNYLYEEGYINAYLGRDFIGVDSITNRVQKLKYIQDTLKKLNKTLITVFAAGKGSFYPEYLPEQYNMSTKSVTNYETYIEKAHSENLDFIDFNRYFIDNKIKSVYSLYPQYGIHWSYYGMCLVADSLIRFIEKNRDIDIPNLHWDDIEISTPKEEDYDIANGMNILFDLKSFDMAYPSVQFVSDSNMIKPSVLVVADSYYWGIFNLLTNNVFFNSHFWFYNQKIYPDSYQTPLNTNQINLKEEIKKHDIIIIMGTDANLSNFGWGFIESTYNVLLRDENNKIQEKISDLRNYIKTNEIWMSQIIKKANEKNISIDSMLTIDAPAGADILSVPYL